MYTHVSAICFYKSIEKICDFKELNFYSINREILVKSKVLNVIIRIEESIDYEPTYNSLERICCPVQLSTPTP